MVSGDISIVTNLYKKVNAESSQDEHIVHLLMQLQKKRIKIILNKSQENHWGEGALGSLCKNECLVIGI